MNRRTMFMFVLLVVVAVVWALGRSRTITVSPNLLDFIGGAAVGLAIATVIVWAAQRTPRD